MPLPGLKYASSSCQLMPEPMMLDELERMFFAPPGQERDADLELHQPQELHPSTATALRSKLWLLKPDAGGKWQTLALEAARSRACLLRRRACSRSGPVLQVQSNACQAAAAVALALRATRRAAFEVSLAVSATAMLTRRVALRLIFWLAATA